MMWQFWIDRGGTFTDVVARRPDGALSRANCCRKTRNVIAMPRSRASAICLGLRRGRRHSAPVRSTRSRWARPSRPTRCWSARASGRCCVITRGFGDLPRIGYQNRPRLFDLEIRLPEMLFSAVEECDERHRCAGRDARAARSGRGPIGAALQQHCGRHQLACAIALAHGYRYPEHETRLAAIAARAIGYHPDFGQPSSQPADQAGLARPTPLLSTPICRRSCGAMSIRSRPSSR